MASTLTADAGPEIALSPARNVIEVRDLTRRFGEFTAVDGISFDVREGEVFAFLGPNGAGKSTTINMLCTLLRPTSGRVTIAGFDVAARPKAVRRNIGLVFQDQTLDDRLTAQENLRFHAVLYRVPGGEVDERIARVLELVDLSDRRYDLVSEFSGGMARRLEIARALMHVPRVLFLDEPTIGLDPQTRALMWEDVLRLREQANVTVFLTTHYMDEAEYAGVGQQPLPAAPTKAFQPTNDRAAPRASARTGQSACSTCSRAVPLSSSCPGGASDREVITSRSASCSVTTAPSAWARLFAVARAVWSSSSS